MERIKIKISPFVIVMAVIMSVTGQIAPFLCYLCAMILHEAAHAVVARRRGYVLNEFRLMPYGAALVGEFETMSHRDEVVVAIAGPFINATLVVVTMAAWWAYPPLQPYSEGFALANVSLLAVNLLPAYPLDGGRVLLALISRFFGRESAYKKIRIVGLFVGFVFAALFFCSIFVGINLSYATMSSFIILSSTLPEKASSYTRLYCISNRMSALNKGLSARFVLINGSAQARMLFKQLTPEYFTYFVVLDTDGSEEVVIAETEVERISSELLHKSVLEAVKSLKNKKKFAKNARNL